MNKDNEINAITHAISQQRFQRFLSHSGDNFEKALELYEKNMRMSAEFYPILSCFEVCLRNKIHESMQKSYGSDWLITEATTFLEQDDKDTVKKVYENLNDKKKIGDNISENMGRVVADLSLGFWVRMLSKKYEESLWRPTIHNGFPNYKGKLRPLRNRIYMIRRLRNRIAHHEPIVFIDNIAGRHTEIIETIGWMCLDTGNWVGRLRPLQLG